MFAPRNIALHAELLKEAEEKIALDPATMRMLLAGGGGLAAGGLGAGLLTHHMDEKSKEQATNRSFGAGLATGVAAPRIMRGLAGMLGNGGQQ
jgi:hypothetical protein